MGVEINQFTNNLIDSIFEDNGLKDDERRELSTGEQQVTIDSEAGTSHVIIHSTSTTSREEDDEGN